MVTVAPDQEQASHAGTVGNGDGTGHVRRMSWLLDMSKGGETHGRPLMLHRGTPFALGSVCQVATQISSVPALDQECEAPGRVGNRGGVQ